ncbi:MAG: type II methionyl aminopeptidase [Candidatus Anstonellales archaeon]
MLSEEELSNYREAGKITAKVLKEAEKLVIPGESLLDIAETVEKMVANEGAKLAFPLNIGINSIAAHYTPGMDEKETIPDEGVVKIDLGVRVNDCIGDSAITIDLSGKNENLLEASKKALEKAIEGVKPGVKVGEIGGIIESVIKEHGFKPIANLTGHKIEKGLLHAGVEIPNVKTPDPYEFKEGDVFAIEPFATNGKGYVNDTDEVRIFSLHAPGNVRMRQGRKVLIHILDNYGLLPFAERWLHKEFKSKLIVNATLREMVEKGMLRTYPVLKEAGEGIVAQFEHTVLVNKNGCEVLTK